MLFTPGVAADLVDCDRVVVGPSEDLVLAVAESPAGTRFCLSGTFSLSSAVRPKDGQVFRGPAEIVSAGSTTGFELKGSTVELSADDVTIEDLEISGFVRGVGCWRGAVIRGSEIHHNSRNGIGCGLTGFGGVVIEGNHLHHNGSTAEVGVGAAGVKIARGDGITLRSNLVEATIGNGLWCDVDCGAIEISNNTVVGSTRKGIFYEVSRGPALITGNTVRENNCSPVHWGDGDPECPRGTSFGPQTSGTAGGGIAATSSTHVTITANILGGNMNAGIAFLDDSRLYDAPFDIAVERNRPNGDAILRCGEWGITCSDNVDVTEPPPPDVTAPSTPDGLAASATRDAIALTWNPATDDTGVTAYEVWRDGARLATTPTTSFRDTDVAPDTSYGYAVRAVDAAGNTSEPSDTVVATTPAPDVVPPSVPSDLQATAGTDAVTLTWTASTDDGSGVASYEVWRDGAPLGTTASTGFTDATIVGGETYAYAVRAVDGVGNASELTSEIVVTAPSPDVTPPSVPTDLTAGVSDDAVALTWSASSDEGSGVAGYEVWRDGAPLGTTGTTALTDTSVTGGVSYAYAVRAVDADGNASELSSEIVVSVPIPPPAAVFSDGFESADLSAWTSVTRVAVGSQIVRTGSFAARAQSTGPATHATKDLGATLSTVEVTAAVRFAAQGKTQVSFLGIQGASTPVVTLFRANNGRLGFRNNVAGRNVTGAAVAALNTWHDVRLRAEIAGTASTVEVWLNGVRLSDLSTTQSLGTSPIRRLQIGEPAKNRSYDVAFDDLAVTSP